MTALPGGPRPGGPRSRLNWPTLPTLPGPIGLLQKSLAATLSDSRSGSSGQAGDAWAAKLLIDAQRNGKLSKMAAGYLPVQPPPALYDYNCGRCRFWTEPNGCTIVKGWIARGAWCAAQMPQKGLRPFTFLPRVTQDLPGWLKDAPRSLGLSHAP